MVASYHVVVGRTLGACERGVVDDAVIVLVLHNLLVYPVRLEGIVKLGHRGDERVLGDIALVDGVEVEDNYGTDAERAHGFCYHLLGGQHGEYAAGDEYQQRAYAVLRYHVETDCLDVLDSCPEHFLHLRVGALGHCVLEHFLLVRREGLAVERGPQPCHEAEHDGEAERGDQVLAVALKRVGSREEFLQAEHRQQRHAHCGYDQCGLGGAELVVHREVVYHPVGQRREVVAHGKERREHCEDEKRPFLGTLDDEASQEEERADQRAEVERAVGARRVGLAAEVLRHLDKQLERVVVNHRLFGARSLRKSLCHHASAGETA